MGGGGLLGPPYVKSVLVKSYTWMTCYISNFSSRIEWRYFHGCQPHVGGPGGRFEGHPDEVQQERFFIWIQECGTCYIPNFSSPIEWKHCHGHQTHVEGPGGQCERHLGGVQQEILFDLNIRVWHMLYTQLFKLNPMETHPWPSTPSRRPWWTLWRTSRRGSARNTFGFIFCWTLPRCPSHRPPNHSTWVWWSWNCFH